MKFVLNSFSNSDRSKIQIEDPKIPKLNSEIAKVSKVIWTRTFRMFPLKYGGGCGFYSNSEFVIMLIGLKLLKSWLKCRHSNGRRQLAHTWDCRCEIAMSDHEKVANATSEMFKQKNNNNNYKKRSEQKQKPNQMRQRTRSREQQRNEKKKQNSIEEETMARKTESEKSFWSICLTKLPSKELWAVLVALPLPHNNVSASVRVCVCIFTYKIQYARVEHTSNAYMSVYAIHIKYAHSNDISFDHNKLVRMEFVRIYLHSTCMWNLRAYVYSYDIQGETERPNNNNQTMGQKSEDLNCMGGKGERERVDGSITIWSI